MIIGQAGDGVPIDDLVHRPSGNEAERTAELLPCPFCGSTQVDVISITHTRYIDNDDTVCVFCDTCRQAVILESNEAEGATETTLSKAIGAWNTRPQETCHDDSFSDVVELPTDANGATIRPGARVTHAGKCWAVRTLMLTDEGEWLLDCQPEDGDPPAGRTIRPELCIATYQRTVEDVLEEYARRHDLCLQFGYDGEDTPDRLRREYADEIRQMLDD